MSAPVCRHHALPPHRRLATAAALALTLALPAGPVLAQVGYRVDDLGFLGVPGADSAQAVGLNDAGVVLATVWNGFSSQAVTWLPVRGGGGVAGRPFGALMDGTARSIDNAGNVYGSLFANGATPLISRGGQLETLPWSGSAAGGRPDGAVYGERLTSGVNGVSSYAFGPAGAGQAPILADLGSLGQGLLLPTTVAAGMNDAHVVVGGSRIDDQGRQHAFWHDANGIRDLGTAAGDDTSAARAVNNAGRVVGWSARSLGTPGNVTGRQAAVFEGGGVQRLGTLGGAESWAEAVNDLGQIVGTSSLPGVPAPGSNPATHGFISTGLGMIDLNHRRVGAGPVIASASTVNAWGQIAATSDTHTVLLLTPTGTLSWAALAGGRFADAAAWDSGGLGFAPSHWFSVVLAPLNAQTVTLDQDARVIDLDLGRSRVNGAVRLQIDGGARLDAAGSVTIGATGTLAGHGRVSSAAVVNHGNVRVGPQQVLVLDGTLQNHGLVAADTGAYPALTVATLRTALANAADGTLAVDAGRRLYVDGPAHVNDGLIELRGRSDATMLRLAGTLDNHAGATLALGSGVFATGVALDNQGLVTVGTGSARAPVDTGVMGQVRNARAGLIEVTTGATLTFFDGVTNDGELRVDAGARVVYLGDVNGGGRFTTLDAGALQVFRGRFSPGHSPGSAELGNTEFAGTLVMELGGDTPGTGHDQISFTGSLHFDPGATLELRLVHDFRPQAGQAFDLFHFNLGAGSASGWENLRIVSTAPGLAWDTTALATGGPLLAAAVPEPGSVALWAAGLLAGWCWRRGRAAAAQRRQCVPTRPRARRSVSDGSSPNIWR